MPEYSQSYLLSKNMGNSGNIEGTMEIAITKCECEWQLGVFASQDEGMR